ncbi:MAG: CbtA family protein [Chloroflexi bacterium]|nr:CbtA family protein [Chloroflexota bacterium]
MRDLWSVVRAVLVAGLIAGTAMALFHTLATAPIIDEAIALEEARAAQAPMPQAAELEPPVSREEQQRALPAGLILYGVFMGLLFGAAFPVLEHLLPAVGTFRRALLAAAASFWALALFPFLRYPANPPGVGQPETIEMRQTAFLLAIVLAVVGLVAACALARRLAQPGNRWPAWALALAAYAGYCLAVFLGLPPNPDPAPVPADLLARFQLFSLAGLALFWLIFGIVAATLLRYFERSRDDHALAPARR